MKFNKMAVTLTAAATVFTSAAGATQAFSTKADAASINTKVTKKTTVTFWHSMEGYQEKALTKLVQDFEKENPNITVKLENQGKYPDLQSKINSTLQSPKSLPTMSQAYPNWLLNAAKSKMLVDLKPYITNKKVGWGSTNKTGIKPSLLKGAQIQGTQYGIPFNKSVETLTYNADMLKKYGVKVPKTMDELKKASETIYKKSNHKVVGAGFDSLANYWVLGMKNDGVNFGPKANFDSKKSQKVVNFYAKGIKKGYFKTAGSAGYLSGDFANEKVAMYVGSSAGEGFAKKAANGKFQYGVANRPSKWNIAQGTDLYIYKSADKNQRLAAFKLMKFLTSKKSQVYWAVQTGYLPVTDEAMNAKEYKESGAKTPAVAQESTKNLYPIPVIKNSNSAMTQTNVAMQGVLSHAKDSNLKPFFKQGQTQLQQAWKQ